MVKTKEYSQDERVAIKYLREAGHSYAEIARQVGCSKSTAHYIYKSLERTGSVKKGARTGRPKTNFREGREDCLPSIKATTIFNFAGAEINGNTTFFASQSLKIFGKAYFT